MKYDLVQYGCDRCGRLSPVMDPDEHMPFGWIVMMPGEDKEYRHLCPICAAELKLKQK